MMCASSDGPGSLTTSLMLTMTSLMPRVTSLMALMLVLPLMVLALPTGTVTQERQWLSHLPKNITFSCDGRISGYYADQASGCQMYHMCDPQSRRYSYLCPALTAFDQFYMICARHESVNCSQADQFYHMNEMIGKPRVNFHQHHLNTGSAAHRHKDTEESTVHSKPVKPGSSAAQADKPTGKVLFDLRAKLEVPRRKVQPRPRHHTTNISRTVTTKPERSKSHTNQTGRATVSSYRLQAASNSTAGGNKTAAARATIHGALKASNKSSAGGTPVPTPPPNTYRTFGRPGSFQFGLDVMPKVESNRTSHRHNKSHRGSSTTVRPRQTSGGSPTHRARATTTQRPAHKTTATTQRSTARPRVAAGTTARPQTTSRGTKRPQTTSKPRATTRRTTTTVEKPHSAETTTRTTAKPETTPRTTQKSKSSTRSSATTGSTKRRPTGRPTTTLKPKTTSRLTQRPITPSRKTERPQTTVRTTESRKTTSTTKEPTTTESTTEKPKVTTPRLRPSTRRSSVDNKSSASGRSAESGSDVGAPVLQNHLEPPTSVEDVRALKLSLTITPPPSPGAAAADAEQPPASAGLQVQLRGELVTGEMALRQLMVNTLKPTYFPVAPLPLQLLPPLVAEHSTDAAGVSHATLAVPLPAELPTVPRVRAGVRISGAADLQSLEWLQPPDGDQPRLPDPPAGTVAPPSTAQHRATSTTTEKAATSTAADKVAPSETTTSSDSDPRKLTMKFASLKKHAHSDAAHGACYPCMKAYIVDEASCHPCVVIR